MTDEGSPLRSLIEGSGYKAYPSLEEALNHRDSTVILEGDDGGTIYLVVPADQVRCDEAILRRLLADIDRMCWKDPDMTRLVFERRPVGSAVSGGMGGGKVGDALWLHHEIEALGVRREIEEVLAGQEYRLDPVGRDWNTARRRPETP